MNGLVLRCGKVVLREATAADDDQIARLMPDDFDHDPTFPLVVGRSLHDHRQAWLRHWLDAFRHPETPGDVFFVFAAEHDGRVVGLQTLEGEDFAARGEVETTSFLTATARGQGLGLAMRTAVLSFAFDTLGAQQAKTAARPDNIASKRVTERLGYEYLGRHEPVVAGSVRPIDCYQLTRQQWNEQVHPFTTQTGKTICVFPRTKLHATILARLLVDAMSGSETERIARITAWLTQGYAAVVTINAATVAAMIGHSQDGKWIIDAIAVNPEHQDQGIGTFMIEFLTQRFPEMKLEAETDADAVDFYRALGFVVTLLPSRWPGVSRYRCVRST